MQATFTNATSLALYGLTGSAQSYAAGAKTGIYPIQNFTDGSADGQYVDSNGARAAPQLPCTSSNAARKANDCLGSSNHPAVLHNVLYMLTLAQQH